MDNITVVTYNILTENYCTGKVFQAPKYDPYILRPKYRYQRIVKKLGEFIEKKAIICLQEVTTKMASKLDIEFKNRAYNLYYHSYGKKENGYMGVAIAVPEKFTVKSIDRFRIADGKLWTSSLNTKPNFIASLLKTISFGYIDFTPKQYWSYKTAMYKWNFMLSIEIEYDTDKTLFVSTVHLPCAYKNPSVILTYAALTVQRIQKIADNSPYILAGDFNIKPNTNEYKLITKGRCNMDEIEKDYPPDDKWRPTKLKLKPMISSLKELNTEEPRFTNYSINSTFTDVPFKDTLDYIFTSNHFDHIEGFHGIKNSFDKFCPNKDEPSDHLLIWSTMKL